MIAVEKSLRWMLSCAAVTCIPLALIALLFAPPLTAGLIVVAAAVLTALRLQLSRDWQPFAFSFWVLAFVLIAICVPAVFTQWGSMPASKAVSPLIQVIMFGMGTTLSVRDFARVLVRPKAVFIGMVLQFSVMPLTGWLLTQLLALPSEVAAGVILIGACPGGVASNVITYLARGDVALSVTMTACSTLLAPLMTPLMMGLLAGEFIDVPVIKLLLSIVYIVVVPTVAGLIANYILQRLHLRGAWIDALLTAAAMLAICIVIGIIVAQSRESLLTIGPLVALAAVIHNAIGYGLGYRGAKWLGLSETECRTISIEVGMQNGGMATALATDVLHSPPAALAGAIFGPWMSISGSVLASWWRRS
jgi:BASS family bile acid:Na+ symporter